MKKPSPSAIRAVAPLSALLPLEERMLVCNLCSNPSERLRMWREHDERDLPILGFAALVFVGADHPDCCARLDAHPRLYSEERGEPGTFPRLCGRCAHRRRFECSHPDLKANGGQGLKVSLNHAFGIVSIHTRNGCVTPVRDALDCAGQLLPGERGHALPAESETT